MATTTPKPSRDNLDRIEQWVSWAARQSRGNVRDLLECLSEMLVTSDPDTHEASRLVECFAHCCDDDIRPPARKGVA